MVIRTPATGLAKIPAARGELEGMEERPCRRTERREAYLGTYLVHSRAPEKWHTRPSCTPPDEEEGHRFRWMVAAQRDKSEPEGEDPGTMPAPMNWVRVSTGWASEVAISMS